MPSVISFSETTASRQHAWLVVGVDPRDTQRLATRTAVGGVMAAFVLGIVGGFPLDMPMPTQFFGIVGPSCGLSRGSTAIARGDFALAWRYNPASFLVMGFGAYGVVRLACGTLFGRWPTVNVRLRRLGWAAVGLAAVALTLYQQTNADFIINSSL